MKYVLPMLICCVLLSGCATLSDHKIMQGVCTHQISLRISANAAIANAPSIKDPVLRQATIDGANTTLALIEACPLDVPAAPG